MDSTKYNTYCKLIQSQLNRRFKIRKKVREIGKVNKYLKTNLYTKISVINIIEKKSNICMMKILDKNHSFTF